MKGTPPKISKFIRGVVKEKARKKYLRKVLLLRICKKFRTPLKIALKPHEVYTITKCSIAKLKYSDIMSIDVVPAIGGDVIESYFADLVTNQILEFCEAKDRNYEEMLPGVQFTYRGEIVSREGHIYSDLEFFVDESDEEDGNKDMGVEKLVLK